MTELQGLKQDWEPNWLNESTNPPVDPHQQHHICSPFIMRVFVSLSHQGCCSHPFLKTPFVALIDDLLASWSSESLTVMHYISTAPSSLAHGPYGSRLIWAGPPAVALHHGEWRLRDSKRFAPLTGQQRIKHSSYWDKIKTITQIVYGSWSSIELSLWQRIWPKLRR